MSEEDGGGGDCGEGEGFDEREREGVWGFCKVGFMGFRVWQEGS